jgi:hypothetical protein
LTKINWLSGGIDFWCCCFQRSMVSSSPCKEIWFVRAKNDDFWSFWLFDAPTCSDLKTVWLNWTSFLLQRSWVYFLHWKGIRLVVVYWKFLWKLSCWMLQHWQQTYSCYTCSWYVRILVLKVLISILKIPRKLNWGWERFFKLIGVISLLSRLPFEKVYWPQFVCNKSNCTAVKNINLINLFAHLMSGFK